MYDVDAIMCIFILFTYFVYSTVTVHDLESALTTAYGIPK